MGSDFTSAKVADQPLQPLCEVFETPYTGETTARGVRATKSVQQGQLIEAAHCILVPRHEYQQHSRHTVLEHYLFLSQSKGDMLLALGLGSLFNHSSSPNLDYRIDSAHLIIRFYAAQPIEPGEELLIYYGPPEKLWFEDLTAPPVSSSSDEGSDGGLSRLQL